MRALLLLSGVLLASTAVVEAAESADQQLQNRLRAHIEFLADDSLRGREPGTDGYTIAANYVASQFLQIGLSAAGNDKSFFQQVPQKQAFLEQGSALLSIHRNGQAYPLKFVEQFYTGPSLVTTKSSVNAEMIFVGYGIEAPELGHSDYNGLDVSGKVVVYLAGQPHDFPSEEGAHFSSGKERARAAVRHGAVGFLSIHTPRAAQRSKWQRVVSRVGKPSMGWVNDQGQVNDAFPTLQVRVMLKHAAAAILFEGSAYTLADLIARDEKAQPLPAFQLAGRVQAQKRSRHEAISSPNVVAVLRGSDPLLANEYMLYTAHLDHIGELHAAAAAGLVDAGTDLINNGALDNASGVSVMLETARMLAEGGPLKRSVLFVAVTSEEKGLVGSQYFAMNPTVPVNSMVAVVNLDMPLLLYDFADVIAFGAQHSSLGATVQDAAIQFGASLTPDPFPERNLFVRSDHYRFVQQGVPSVFLVTGMKSLQEGVEARAIFEGFLQQHYHQPGDDLSLPIHYRAAARFTRINARIGELVANQGQRPVWHEDSFFGNTYAK